MHTEETDIELEADDTAQPVDENEIKAAEEFYRRNETYSLDDATAQLRNFAHEKITEFYNRALSLVAAYDGDKLMALDCLFFALGLWDLIENAATGKPMTCQDIAVKHYGDATRKATVNKCVLTFQSALGLESMPGQRCEAGRIAMSEARKQQLQ